MHHITVNGARLVVYHQRTFEQIHDRPHIARWVSSDGRALWAVYYLMGRQSRIRCTLYDTLGEAVRQASYVARVNARAPRFLNR